MDTMNGNEDLRRVIATEEAPAHQDGPSAHLDQLDQLHQRIRALEAAVGDLRTVKAQAEAVEAEHPGRGRKTIPVDRLSLLAKGASDNGVDDALRSLSVEQRIAVKAGLHRAGLLR